MPDSSPPPSGSAYITVAGTRVKPKSASSNLSINDLPTAQAEIPLNDTSPYDFTPMIQILTARNEQSEHIPIFTGHVLSAKPNGEFFTISAQGGRAMVESTVGITVHNAPAVDVLRLLTNQAGTPLNIRDAETLEQLPNEVFIVELPLMGVSVDRPAKVSGVEFLPFPSPEEDEPFAKATSTIIEQWGQPTARARTYVTAKWMDDADRAGVARIEAVVDAMLATASFGHSHDPWGSPIFFDRNTLRSRPSVIPLVFTQGVVTNRRWLHQLGSTATVTALSIDRFSRTWSQILSSPPSPELSRALRSLRDAADTTRDVFDRCHAISSAFEFYTAKSAPPRIVSKRTLKEARKALAGLAADSNEIDRLLTVLGQANSAPLRAKITHQAAADGTPVSEVEWDLIAKLRSARNQAVHGRSEGSTPSKEEVLWGVSITSRVLLYRWAREAAASQ